MKSLQLVLYLLWICSCAALSALEAEGLVRYGFCTSAVETHDCTWTSSCTTGRVGCIADIYNPSQSGKLFMLNYVASNQDVRSFAGITHDFVTYFENITTLIVRDERLSPPVRWTLNSGIATLPKLSTLYVFSQEGGLYGTLPQRFQTTSSFSLVINGSVEGTLPEAWMQNPNFNSLKINNHRLVGTIPASYNSHYFTLFDVSSPNGNLVGDFPESTGCQLSGGYTSGEGNNGGLFCKCSTSCAANSTSGNNACYDYLNPGTAVDSCATLVDIPGCTASKQSMRYGTLCYDECAAGCGVDAYCGVDFSSSTPVYGCFDLIIDTVTTPSSYDSTDSATVTLGTAILLSLWL